ncbi:MAG TPA: OsmC family protein [Clostridia bacterium]|nr:OsmC family protein [Clostridia bacterium]
MNININWLEDKNFKGTTKDGEGILISPTKNLNGYISPPDLLLMSLGSCTGLFIMPAAKELGVVLEDFDISVKGTKSENPPKLFEKITIAVTFIGDLSQDDAKEILEKSHQRCFILHSLDPSITIENEIIIK